MPSDTWCYVTISRVTWRQSSVRSVFFFFFFFATFPSKAVCTASGGRGNDDLIHVVTSEEQSLQPSESRVTCTPGSARSGDILVFRSTSASSLATWNAERVTSCGPNVHWTQPEEQPKSNTEENSSSKYAVPTHSSPEYDYSSTTPSMQSPKDRYRASDIWSYRH